MTDVKSDLLEPQERPSPLGPAQGEKYANKNQHPGHTTESASVKPAPAVELANPHAVTADISAAPEGGLRAWLVVLGSGFVFFSCLGFVNTFGVFQQYYMAHQLRHHTPDNVAWIGSLMAFVQSGAGAITGSLFDRFGNLVRMMRFLSLPVSPLIDTEINLHMMTYDRLSAPGRSSTSSHS